MSAGTKPDCGTIARIFNPYRFPQPTPRSGIMAKGQQRSNKEAKKPKQDKSPAKPISPQAVKPAVTTVIPDRRKKP